MAIRKGGHFFLDHFIFLGQALVFQFGCGGVAHFYISSLLNAVEAYNLTRQFSFKKKEKIVSKDFFT